MQDERRNVFISHAGEDFRIVRPIALSLESHGYSTWYYERDSVPGISHLEQCRCAIENSESFLLLISRHSLKSHEVTTELRKAHQRNKTILPLRLRVSDAAFRDQQPEWDTAIGTAVSAEVRVGDPAAIVQKLLKSLELLAVQPGLPPDDPDGGGGGGPEPVNGPWLSDANQIDVRDLDRIVFHNPIIDDFLQSRGKYFLSANKGLGKTLLLTYKRTRLAETHTESGLAKDHSNVFFVPQGKPYLDFMDDVHGLDKKHKDFLQELVNTKRLWTLALRISALSHHTASNRPLITEREEAFLAELPELLRMWTIEGGRVEPTVVFREMLEAPVHKMNRAIDKTENFLRQKFRQINSGTYIFIDKVDQGISLLSRAAWIAVQAGLIEAAWDLMNANNHVRIYATIRQEAFSNYQSPIKTNLHGATTILQYSREELSDLLDQLTQCYEHGKTFKQFIEMNVVKHPPRAFGEDSFEYLHRHTLGRPRDFVIVASALSRNRKSLDEPMYRRVVNESSSADLVANIFDEMSVFLDSLDEEEERFRFFSLLPCNILTQDEVIEVCCKFNGIERSAYDAAMYDRISPQLNHPFWELFNAGLLGVVDYDPERRRSLQQFKQPHDMINNSQASLPDVEFYLVHPALDTFIRRQRGTGKYHVFQQIVVGHDCDWNDSFKTICNIERYLFKTDDVDLRELTYHVLNEVGIALGNGESATPPQPTRESAEWELLKQQLADGSHDDVLYWLEDLLRAPAATKSSES